MRPDAEPVEVGDLSRASSSSGTRVRVLGEILGTMMLVLVVLALSESRHASAPAGWFFPLIVGTTVGMIILIEAPFSQASLNPTRDLGPRIMLLLMGFGSVAFPGPRGGLALLVTTIGPIIGGLLGMFIHDRLVRGMLTELAVRPAPGRCRPQPGRLHRQPARQRRPPGQGARHAHDLAARRGAVDAIGRAARRAGRRRHQPGRRSGGDRRHGGPSGRDHRVLTG
jgi:hypothetical protein